MCILGGSSMRRKHRCVMTAKDFRDVVLTIVLFTTSSSSEKSENVQPNPYYNADHVFVSGRTVEYMPDPIFYDGYVPILYQVSIPKHTDSALRILWGDVESCPKTGKLCPIASPLFKIIKKLGDDMGFWKPYYLNHTVSKKEPLKRRTGYEVDCNVIGPHFFRTYTSKLQLKSYETALHACSRIPQDMKIRVPGENWVVDKAIYYQMLDNFKKTYFNDLPQEGNVDWAITMNTYASVHGLLLTNHVMESVRLASAMRICQSGIIPQTFISIDMLTEALKSASKNLTRWGYQLVYTNLVQDIEEYYKLPLADCTFTDDYTFVIRVLAPTRRVEVSHRLIEINTIPFLEELSNTSGIPERLCRLKLPASKLTLIETNTGLLLDTHCEPNQLCKTSEVSTVFENDACTSSLLTTEDRHLITHTCKFSCFPIDSAALPLIRRISSDTYVVVGSASTKINLNCFDKPTEMIPIPLKNVGAMRIKLACNCHILYSNHVSYRPKYPCGGKTEMEHILPYHWYTKQLKATLGKYDKEFEDGNSTESVPPGESGRIGNITAPDFPENVEDDQIEKSLEKQEEDLGRRFFPKHEVVTRKVVSVSSDGIMIHLYILWTLVIALGVATIVLGYQVRKLTKWRQAESYKETRVLYSIPESEEAKINSNSGPGGTRVAWEAFYDLFTVH